MLYKLIIYDHTSEQSNDKVIIADSAEMKITQNEKFLELNCTMVLHILKFIIKIDKKPMLIKEFILRKILFDLIYTNSN